MNIESKFHYRNLKFRNPPFGVRLMNSILSQTAESIEYHSLTPNEKRHVMNGHHMPDLD